jgi:hypothetical protein
MPLRRPIKIKNEDEEHYKREGQVRLASYLKRPRAFALSIMSPLPATAIWKDVKTPVEIAWLGNLGAWAYIPYFLQNAEN